MRYANVKTAYGPRWYRSKTEARWAAWFDFMGVRFHYEQCKVNLGYCRYVPDFHLLDLGAWFEVKAGNYGPAQLEKVRGLAAVTRERAFLFGEYDIGKPGHGFVWDGEDLQGGSLFRWAVCPECRRPDIVRITRPGDFTCGCPRRPVSEPTVIAAAFEHVAGLFA